MSKSKTKESIMILIKYQFHLSSMTLWDHQFFQTWMLKWWTNRAAMFILKHHHIVNLNCLQTNLKSYQKHWWQRLKTYLLSTILSSSTSHLKIPRICHLHLYVRASTNWKAKDFKVLSQIFRPYRIQMLWLSSNLRLKLFSVKLLTKVSCLLTIPQSKMRVYLVLE